MLVGDVYAGVRVGVLSHGRRQRANVLDVVWGVLWFGTDLCSMRGTQYADWGHACVFCRRLAMHVFLRGRVLPHSWLRHPYMRAGVRGVVWYCAAVPAVHSACTGPPRRAIVHGAWHVRVLMYGRQLPQRWHGRAHVQHH